MTTWAQRSFAGGEIAPSLYARCDTVKYQTGLRTCRNFFLPRHGGAQNRAGTQFIGEVANSGKTVRLIPFIFNSDQTYMLEFGNLYMRVIHDGAYITLANKTITGVTQASQAVVTSAAHGYSNGDEVAISSVLGMTELNNRNFKVSDVAANTFKLKYMDGATYVNSSAFGSYTSGGIANKIYQIATPYLEADLPALKYIQSADVITIVHGSYAPATLSRSAHDSWTLANIAFGSSIVAPTISGFQLIYLNTEAPKTITAITKASPGVVTSNSHGYSAGDKVTLAGIVGMTELNGVSFRVRNPTKNTFELSNVDATITTQSYDTSNLTVYSSGGTATKYHNDSANDSTDFWAITHYDPTTGEESLPSYITDSNHAKVSSLFPVTFAMSAANYHNLYRQINGVYGLVGSFPPGTAPLDIGSIPDVTIPPPTDSGLFASSGNYPAVASYFQQRLILANSNNNPEGVWASVTSRFFNFNSHRPIQDSDAVSFKMVGRQVNSIRNVIDLGQMITFTASGEWSIQGDQAGILRPGQVNPRQHSYNGSHTMDPILIDSTALYVQARENIIRDLAFDWQVNGYRGNDLTIFSSHLFDNYRLLDWAYQKIPHSNVWSVRDDGTLLGLTYIREQQILGWHRHDFDGVVENVAVIPEGSEDSVYLVIKRTINGHTVRYVERFHTRKVVDVIDNVFMDASLSYDGRNTTSQTMSLTGGSTWAYDENLTLTTSVGGYFKTTDVGKEIHLTGADGEIIRALLTAYVSGTIFTVRANRTVPASLQGTTTQTWAVAVKTVSGLWHIEGKSVSVFADRFVVANPNNEDYDVLSVTNGALTLDKAYSVIHVGLPYTSDLETLDIDTHQGESVANKKKLVTRLSIEVESSRGIWAGGSAPSDDSLDGLMEYQPRENESYDDPVPLVTGTVQVNLLPEWNSNGRVFIRQTDPIPLSVLAVIPDGLVPFKGGG